ncbi:MAG TPA: hypothetical protein PL045_07075 [Chitinophagaceae bacterium]|nr:hypothetical protein [Chitinophagaceae bacterium]
MNICGHLIKKDQIVGIGPLMKESVGDITTQNLYGSFRLFYLIHFKSSSIKIESTWMDTKGLSDSDIKYFQTVENRFTAEYNEAHALIEEIINPPSKQKKLLELETHYTQTKNTLTALFQDMQPVPGANDIAGRQHKVLNDIAALKTFSIDLLKLSS